MTDSSTPRHTRKRGLPFHYLVVLPFCITLALQLALCWFVLFKSETFTGMEDDAYSLFSERVTSRAGYLENEMVFRWSDFGDVPRQLQATIDAELQKYDALAADMTAGSDVATSIIQSTSDEVISLASRAEVEGVYFILSDGSQAAGGETQHTAIYVRDSNPKTTKENNSDLLLAACPLSVARQTGMALDGRWSASFPLAAEGTSESDFFYQPLRGAERYPAADVDDLGYWGSPVDLGWAGTKSITYSMPIRDGAGEVCGVLGVEVRVDRLATYFPYRELGLEENGSYALVTTTPVVDDDETPAAPDAGESQSYQVLATTGASYTLYTEGDSFTAFGGDRKRATIAAQDGTSDQAVASMQEISLYDSTSPFASEHWTLVGMEGEQHLFSASRSLAQTLMYVFVASLVVGVILAVIMASMSSSRLRRLMREVRAARPGHAFTFKRTSVAEIDELADAVRVYADEVAATSARLSSVLALSDRMIGAFEYSQQTDVVMLTDGFMATLGESPSDGGADSAAEAGVDAGGSVAASADAGAGAAGSAGASVRESAEVQGNSALTPDAFKKLIGARVAQGEVEAANRYVFPAKGGHWVRLTVNGSTGDDRVVGFVEDVTDEINTRRRLEHERDHDVLTGLLNRRAFEHGVEEKLATHASTFAAMLMFDLDSLKHVNDTYGHEWGDLYIKTAGETLQHVLGAQALCARISGDEFMAFIEDCTCRADVEALLAVFRRELAAISLTSPDGAALEVRASMGVAMFPDDTRDAVMLKQYADFAMYESKRDRKGELRFFDRESYDAHVTEFEAQCE